MLCSLADLHVDDLPAADEIEGARRRRCGARVSEKEATHTANGAMAKAIDKWKGFDQG